MPDKLDLNLILSHACPNGGHDDATGISTFIVETHCIEWTITAKLLTVLPTITYEILDYSMKAC